MATSAIWEHGAEYIRALNPEGDPVFICDHCDSVLAISAGGSISNIGRHLKDRHHLKLETYRKRKLLPGLDDLDSDISSSSQASSIQPRRIEFRALYTNPDIDAFRQAIIELAVVRQLSFSTLTSAEFRKPFLILQPTLEKFLAKSPQTIANWVYEEFENVKIQVKS